MQTHVPTVRQFMTPNPVIIDGGLSIADAFTRMFQIHARHLPVYTNGHLVGIISDRDIGHLSAVQGIDPNRCTAEQACSPNPYVCAPETPLAEVAQVLAQHRFGAALVMEGGNLVGLFTVTDAMLALVAVLQRDETQAADPQHTWTASTNPDLDLDTRQGRPDLDPSPDRAGDTPTPRDPVHAPDPRRDALQSQQARHNELNQSPQQIGGGGVAQNMTTDIRSDVGRRSEIRRAAATVHRSGTP